MYSKSSANFGVPSNYRGNALYFENPHSKDDEDMTRQNAKDSMPKKDVPPYDRRDDSCESDNSKKDLPEKKKDLLSILSPDNLILLIVIFFLIGADRKKPDLCHGEDNVLMLLLILLLF